MSWALLPRGCREPQRKAWSEVLPSSTQETDAVRDALTPSLACAAAHAGDLEALQTLAELVSPPVPLGTSLSYATLLGGRTVFPWGLTPVCPGPPGWAASSGPHCTYGGHSGCAKPQPRGAPPPFLSLPCGLPDPAHPFLSGGRVLVSFQGGDLSLEDFNGQTPLHVAARRGHAGVVTLLLQRGVDVNARDEDGLSPLLLAVRGRYGRRDGRLGKGDAGWAWTELPRGRWVCCLVTQLPGAKLDGAKDAHLAAVGGGPQVASTPAGKVSA